MGNKLRLHNKIFLYALVFCFFSSNFVATAEKSFTDKVKDAAIYSGTVAAIGIVYKIITDRMDAGKIKEDNIIRKQEIDAKNNYTNVLAAQVAAKKEELELKKKLDNDAIANHKIERFQFCWNQKNIFCDQKSIHYDADLCENFKQGMFNISCTFE